MSMESGGVASAVATKVGLVLLGLFAALIGAVLMAITRPPRNRKEMFLQATTALGSSFLFGGAATLAIGHWFTWAASSVEVMIAIHGLIGAMAWGLFGGLAVLREKFSKDPIQIAKDIKDIL